MVAGGAMVLGAAMVVVAAIPTRRVGGLVFWRIGRLGGSVYISRVTR